ncbi:MAG: hypothetical protein ACRCZI_01395 [Cetobacterium sp.]
MAKVLGIPDLRRALDGLASDLRKRVIVRGLRAGARVLVSHAKSIAPVLKEPTKNRRPGVLRQNIKTFVSKKARQAGQLGVYVTVRASRRVIATKDRVNDPFYFRWQEAGWYATGRKKLSGGERKRKAERASGKYRFVEGKKFLGMTAQTRGPEAIRVALQEVQSFIAQQNKRV